MAQTDTPPDRRAALRGWAERSSRSTASIGSALNRYQIVAFFVLAFALSWAVWGTMLAQQQGLLSFHIPQSLAFWAVGLAAVAMAALTGGTVGVRDLVRRMLRWRVGARWYATALLLPGAICVLVTGLHVALGGTAAFGVTLSLDAALAYLAYGVGFFLLTEETAWRGFALPRLQAGRSALSASLILGLLWGLWHAPLFGIAGSAQASMPFGGFLLLIVAQSIMTTWLYNNTGGSVLLAALFHAATDATYAYTGTVLVGDARLFWLSVAVSWVVALTLVVVAGPARLSRRQRGVSHPRWNARGGTSWRTARTRWRGCGAG